MIEIVKWPEEAYDEELMIKSGQGVILDRSDGTKGLLFICPDCGQLISCTDNQNYIPETKSIILKANGNASSIQHVGCTFHKTLTNGEWT